MKFKTLDHFTQGYIECALWSSHDESDGGDPLDANYSFEDISDETVKEMAADCLDFQQTNADLLKQYYEQYSSEDAGHDFWLTRNHHGAGFWDRGLDKVGDELTAMAHPYGEANLYVGDDGRIYS